eukprot:2578267-Pleurochrysis_carterae.AAC.4
MLLSSNSKLSLIFPRRLVSSLPPHTLGTRVLVLLNKKRHFAIFAIKSCALTSQELDIFIVVGDRGALRRALQNAVLRDD